MDTCSTILYHGPTGGALPFFEGLGFACPPRKDLPSFLPEVTTPSGVAPHAPGAAGPAVRVPADGGMPSCVMRGRQEY